MKPTKNSVSQALKRVCPTITKKQLFEIIGVPDTMTTNMRYWRDEYGIKSWEKRSPEERDAAIQAARRATEVRGLV